MIARSSLLLAATLVLVACGGSRPATVVETDKGEVSGLARDGVISWKGIPFAAPPTGELRWRAPQPAAAWDDPLDAREYRSDCMQKPFPSDAAPLGTTPSEDCLYLNVWKPEAVDDDGPLPVVFWIYGGGFVNGGASPPVYSGAPLAEKGVVFVSANYRVGRFGTFAHPALTAQDADDGLIGNYGFLDQIAALKWVEANIASFGGDPDNVTIIGESAGGMSVFNMVTSPLAEGLFDKAVAMSGGSGRSTGGAGLKENEATGIAFAASKNIAEDDPQALEKLRALSADAVTDGLNMMALFTPGERTFSTPFIDGRIAVDTARAYDAGAFAHVPMMIGATSADMGGKTGFMIAGARSASAMLAEKGVPVWSYRFSYVAESLDPGEGAPHASDIPFFLDTQSIKYGEATTERDAAMGDTISEYIVRFARTGDPNGGDLPAWPRYSGEDDVIMDFAADGKARAIADPWGPEIDAAMAGSD